MSRPSQDRVAAALVAVCLPLFVQGCFRLFNGEPGSRDSGSEVRRDADTHDVDHGNDARPDADAPRDGDTPPEVDAPIDADQDTVSDGTMQSDADGAEPTCMVTTLADSHAGSLRACIQAANAGQGPDVVRFDPSVFRDGAVLCLSDGPLPDLLDDAGVIIDGSGVAVVIDGGGSGSSCATGPIDAPGLTLASSNNVIRSVTVRRFGDNGISVVPAMVNNRVEGCVLSFNTACGIQLAGGPSRHQNNEILGNAISSNGLRGIFLADAHGNTIVGNVVRANVGAGIGLFGTTSGSGDNLIISNEIAENGGAGIVIGDAGSDGNRVVANTIWGNDEGLTVYGGLLELFVLHNTFDANTTRNMSLRTGAKPTRYDIRNNIISNVDTGIGVIGTISGVVDYNLYFRSTCFGCPPGSDQNSIIDVDPQFVLAPTDYELTHCTSPAINAGVDLGEDQPDLNGPPAPPPSDNGYNGPAPDLGAHESVCD